MSNDERIAELEKANEIHQQTIFQLSGELYESRTEVSMLKKERLDLQATIEEIKRPAIRKEHRTAFEKTIS